MPIEIRELIIKAKVAGEKQEATTMIGGTKEEKKAMEDRMKKAMAEMIIQVMKRKNER